VTLPLRLSGVPYFDNAYRGDLIVTQGVLYYIPWVNVALEQKQQHDLQMDRLFPLSIVIELVAGVIKSWNQAHTKPKVETLGLWLPGQTDDALKARLDAYIEYEKTQTAPITDYEYGVPRPMRFAAPDIKNLSLNSTLKFDTEFDSHDFGISVFDQTQLAQALKEAGFLVTAPA